MFDALLSIGSTGVFGVLSCFSMRGLDFLFDGELIRLGSGLPSLLRADLLT